MAGESVRQGDIERIEQSVRLIATDIPDLKARVSDLRVLMAEGYVRRTELDNAKLEMRQEIADATQANRAEVSANSAFVKWAIGISSSIQALVVTALAVYVAVHH